MKWIKASERLPETGIGFLKYVWVRNTDTKCGCMHALEDLLKLDGLNNIEWLDESAPVPDKVELGEWQQCPVCNGTGRAMDYNNPIPSTLDVCTVCGGKKIIAKPNWQSTQSDAVEFAEWTDDNGWWREVYNFDGDSEKLWSKTSSCWENITTEQLYQLFKQK